MKKKKVLSILLVLVFAISLIGCSKGKKDEGAATSGEVTTAPTVAATEAPTATPTVAPTATPTPTAEPTPVVVEKDAKAVIECEAFDESGDIVAEDCSDENGGKSLGGINNDDYAAYFQVNFGEGGFSRVTFRASSAMENGGDIEIHQGTIDGTLLGTCHIPGTGDWSKWETFDFDVPDLAAVSGTQDIFLVFKNGGDFLFNLNWFQFKTAPKDAAEAIQAEDFVAVFDQVSVEANTDEEGAMGIGGLNNDDYTAYDVNFGDGGYKKLTFRASSAMDGGTVEIHLGSLDGDVLGSCKITGTGDWSKWDTFTADAPDLAAVKGNQTIYLLYKDGGDWLFNINWFKFDK